MKKSGGVTFVYILIATILDSIGATTLLAQDYVRDSQPKLFSYDELVQLSLDQEMSPELAEKLMGHRSRHDLYGGENSDEPLRHPVPN
jgi:hypothetical protein